MIRRDNNGKFTKGTRHFPPEWKRSVVKANKSDQHRENVKLSRLGQHHSEMVKKKIRRKVLGRHHTEEAKKKISKNNAKYWLGKKRSEEFRKRMSKMMLGNKNCLGHKNTLGFKFSKASKLKISEALKEQWRNGKRKPRSIIKRDSYGRFKKE